jgi:hypothetical protein
MLSFDLPTFSLSVMLNEKLTGNLSRIAHAQRDAERTALQKAKSPWLCLECFS